MAESTDIKNIENRILLIRGQRVMIDTDIADLYGVTNKRLNEQVKRNKDRFPADFMFQLTPREKAEVVANCDHLSKLKFSRTLPYAFTEHGAIMAASVLNTSRAVEMSVFVIRAFVKLREILSSHKELYRKIRELEQKTGKHGEAIRAIILTIQEMIGKNVKEKKRKIGFQDKNKKS